MLKIYLILLFFIQANCNIGNKQFYRSNYFDERSIHADIARDVNVVANHVKAFNSGKSKVDKSLNDRAADETDMDGRRVEAACRKMIGIVNVQSADKIDVNKLAEGNDESSGSEGEKGIVLPNNRETFETKSKYRINCDQTYKAAPLDEHLKNNPHKRDTNVAQINREEDTNNKETNIVENQQPAITDHGKRMFHGQKHYVNPNEDFRKRNGEPYKGDLNNGQIRPDYPYRQNKQILENDVNKIDPQNMTPLSMDIPQAEHFMYQQALQGQMPQQDNFIKAQPESVERHENPTIAKLFEKQRHIENLKQLLLQVESKFQMEVNEVGRLQQSVSEAEKDLDEAVRLMQEVKMRNIKGMRDIEAAQDSAGRNLESKALKAHAEESQLAIHDQILFSERQRLNALRAQMIYLQTELAAAQTSPIDENSKSYANFQTFQFPYKSPLTDTLKYYQNLQNRRPNYGPYLNMDTNENYMRGNFTQNRHQYNMFK